jgi:hypothetical protein
MPAPGVCTCEETVETHAFLTRGQFQCDFRFSGGGMLEAARACSKRMSDETFKSWIEIGMHMCDYNKLQRGHAAMCASLLADFPHILRR